MHPRVKAFLKTAEEFFLAAIMWPVLGCGTFYILTTLLHFPLNWFTVLLILVITFYLGIKVGIGERF